MSRQVLRCAAVLRVSALAGALAVVTAGCSRERTTQGVDGEPPPSLPSSSETSLSLKRGTITVEGQKGTFKPCGEDQDLWIVDQSDGSYQEVAATVDPNDAMYVEARGERGPIPEDEPGASAYSGAFFLEQILYAGAPAASRGCEALAPAYIVRARGNEPPLSWTVEVNEQKMEWMQDKGEAITFDMPRELDTEGAVSYEGRNEQHTLQLIIDSQSCRDPTTEEFFAYSARAVLDEKEFKGCARVGR
jgi:uncharacterized membrane protein